MIVQIEHIDAVANIDDILTTPGLDGFLVGPYDLSGSLGKPGDFEDSKVKNALDKILGAARKHNIPAGFHSVSTDPDEAALRRNQGYHFLAFSMDSIFMGDMAVEQMEKLRDAN